LSPHGAGVCGICARRHLGWQGADDATCTVQRKSDLQQDSWSNVTDGIVGTGSLCLTNDISAPQAFCRITAEQGLSEKTMQVRLRCGPALIELKASIF
jgi:hypothetical protein